MSAQSQKPEKIRTFEENLHLAHLLDQTADLLEAQEANPFRVKAYRDAAAELRKLGVDVREIHRSRGRPGLLEIPHIGESLSRAIEIWLTTGALGILQRLRGDTSGGDVLCTLAGLGPKLAQRIHEELGISTLEELDAAARDGRLARVSGIGPRRFEAIADELARRLPEGRPPSVAPAAPEPERARRRRPDVAEILSIDREYRERAAAGDLPLIAPRRFNPGGTAWLPVLHARRGPRHYTALFSNTARAHELGCTRDWVIIYLDDGSDESQWTVVTEHRGPLRGKRVVRGREGECADYHQAHAGWR